jgi:hypothetical protein
MKHGTHRNFVAGVIVLAVSAAPAAAATKHATAKKKPPNVTTVRPIPRAFQSTFIVYDVGTLSMTAKSGADATYAVGPFQLTGRSADSTVYGIGTMSMTGKAER